jgi:hypothetical protein
LARETLAAKRVQKLELDLTDSDRGSPCRTPPHIPVSPITFPVSVVPINRTEFVNNRPFREELSLNSRISESGAYGFAARMRLRWEVLRWCSLFLRAELEQRWNSIAE